MKYKGVFVITILFLITVCFSGCNDKDHSKPFSLIMGSESYEVRIGTNGDLPIVSGNGNYTLQVEDDNIIDASHLYDGNFTFGSIHVTAKKKGETTLSITDAAITATVHKFDLTGSSQEVFKLLYSKFGMDWGKASGMQTRSSPASLIYLNLKEVGTAYDVKTYIGYSSWQDYLPEGYLD